MDNNLDLDGDGVVGKKEMDLYMLRRTVQRRMAITSMVALIATGTWMVLGMPADRLEAMGSLLDLYWITLGGVIATYMGAEAYSTASMGK